MKYELVSVALVMARLGAAVHGAESSTPEDLMRSIYRDHQPWAHREISFNSRAILSKYFDEDLTRLFLREDTCRKRTQEICNLNFDPILCSQDFDDSLPLIEIRKVSGTSASYKVTIDNLGKRNIVYSLTQIPAGWRVGNIQCPEGPSLRAILMSDISEQVQQSAGADAESEVLFFNAVRAPHCRNVPLIQSFSAPPTSRCNVTHYPH